MKVPSVALAVACMACILATTTQAQTPPTNDDCGSAQAIAGSGTFAFDTTNATTDGPDPECGPFTKDIWYEWTAPQGGPWLLTFCSSPTGFDTKVAIWDSWDCATMQFSEVGCNDDTCLMLSEIRWVATSGQVFRIRIGGYNESGAGSFDIRPDPDPSVGFCFPNIGGVRGCPCGNPPAAFNQGCDNFVNTTMTSGTGGARLTASGSPVASTACTLVFHVTKAHNPPNNVNLHIFWKGTSILATGVKNGFGVRCISGALKKIYQGPGLGTPGVPSSNTIDWPNGTQTTDAWTASQMPPAGTTLVYYDNFRDLQGPTTCFSLNDRFNASHAVSITWGP